MPQEITWIAFNNFVFLENTRIIHGFFGGFFTVFFLQFSPWEINMDKANLPVFFL